MGADNGAVDQQGEILNLDALDRETKPAFRFQLGGRTWAMSDPEELDWHDQLALEEATVGQSIQLLLGDQWDEFQGTVQAPGWKLVEVFKGWAKHVGIEIPESLASPDFSAPTAKPSRPTSKRTTASGSRTSRRGG